VLITNKFHEFCWSAILGTSDDRKASYGPKSIHISIMSKTMGSHRQYDTRRRCGTKPGPSRAKVGPTGPTPLADQAGFGIFLKFVFNMCQLMSARRVSNMGRQWCHKAWPPDRVKWPAGLTSRPPKPKLRPRHRLNPPINTLLFLPVEGVMKVRFSPPSQGASKFNLCRVERDARFWGPEDFLACRDSFEWLECGSFAGIHSGSTKFSKL
jgi:hypothetical protein